MNFRIFTDQLLCIYKQLKSGIQQEWTQIPFKKLQQSVSSVPKALKRVIKGSCWLLEKH